jgi:hypothetical protein
MDRCREAAADWPRPRRFCCAPRYNCRAAARRRFGGWGVKFTVSARAQERPKPSPHCRSRHPKSYILAASAGVLLANCVSADASEIDHRLVMPFSCALQGEKVTVLPSTETAYQIYGQHEVRPFGACRESAGEANGDLCRTWIIHKFDVSCGGARVAWSTVAAAIGRSKRPDKVWIERGQVHLVATPNRAGLPYLAPAKTERQSCEQSWARTAYALDQSTRHKPCAVLGTRVMGIALPTGYAPIRPFGARLLTTAAASQFAPAPLLQPKLATKAATPVPPSNSGQATVKTTLERSVAHPVPTLPSPTHPVIDRPASDYAASLPMTPADWTTVVTRQRRDVLETNPSGVLVFVATALLALAGGLALRFGYGAAHVARFSPWRVRTPTAETVPFDAAHAAGTTDTDALAAAQMAGHQHVIALAGEIEIARQDLLQLTDAALRAVLGEELYLVGQSINHVAKSPPETVAGWAHVHHMLHGHIVDIHRIRRIAASVQLPSVNADPHAASNAMLNVLPQDREAAYIALGLNGDAAESAAKKVVDGLRQTWHPDTARDDADRVNREARMKQINAAWDLIRARPE